MMNGISDGVIHRYEAAFDLAWLTMREYLSHVGFININSPIEVLRTAFTAELIDDVELWEAMHKARNLTTHTYDASKADELASDILTKFVAGLTLLDEKLAFAANQ